MSLTVKLVNY